jgi:hypothetical protein
VLLWVTMTRPEIMFHVSHCCGFMDKPSRRMWRVALQILKYLSKTPHMLLTYRGSRGMNMVMFDDTKQAHKPSVFNRTMQLLGFADSDFATCPDTRRSITSSVLMLAGAAIYWASRKQTTVALSTAESEFMSLTATGAEVMHKRRLLSEMGFPQESPTPVLEDNQAAIAMATNPGSHHKRTKHIDVRYRKICEWVREGAVLVKYVTTKLQVADLLTKALAFPVFDSLRGIILGRSNH